MKKANFLITVFLLSFNAKAAIFGHDKRIEAQLEAPEFEASIARSVPALILKNKLERLPNGDYRLKSKSLRELYNFCAYSKFSDQKLTANCSASYIGNKKILTAGHCLSPEMKMGCSDYFFVFDYAKKAAPFDSELIPKDNVYECEKVLYNEYKEPFYKEDLAVIELTREVLGREPIKVNTDKRLQKGDELFMIGYPLGIYQKLVTSGQVLKTKFEDVSFSNNLDSFSVNSGGPIFDKNTGEQVGVLVRGTASNWTENIELKCNDWTYAKEGDFSDGNTLMHMKKNL